MKEEKKFANEIELICAINSTMNRQSQLDCITSAGRPNFPIYKALLRSKNENSNLLYSVVVHSTNSPSRLSERLPGWCRGMCPARGGVQKLQKTTFARHLTPGQNFLIFHCHFSVYENADGNAGRSLMNH